MNAPKRPGAVYAQVILLAALSALLIYASANGLNQPAWKPLILGLVHLALIPLLLWGKKPGFRIAFAVLLFNVVLALIRLNLINVIFSVLWMYPLLNPDTWDYYGVKLSWLRALRDRLTPAGRRCLKEKEADRK